VIDGNPPITIIVGSRVQTDFTKQEYNMGSIGCMIHGFGGRIRAYSHLDPSCTI